jgi:hypothetical protein
MEREAMMKELEEAYEGLSDLNLELDKEMRPADADWPDRDGDELDSVDASGGARRGP